MTIRDVPPLAWKVPDIAPFEGLERNERIVTVDQLAEYDPVSTVRIVTCANTRYSGGETEELSALTEKVLGNTKNEVQRRAMRCLGSCYIQKGDPKPSLTLDFIDRGDEGNITRLRLVGLSKEDYLNAIHQVKEWTDRSIS